MGRCVLWPCVARTRNCGVSQAVACACVLTKAQGRLMTKWCGRGGFWMTR